MFVCFVFSYLSLVFVLAVLGLNPGHGAHDCEVSSAGFGLGDKVVVSQLDFQLVTLLLFSQILVFASTPSSCTRLFYLGIDLRGK